MSDLFWPMLAAVLGGNLLTVGFVWSMINISKREDRKESPGVYMIGFLLPMAFLIAALAIALGFA